jgi:hypothetical protein
MTLAPRPERACVRASSPSSHRYIATRVPCHNLGRSLMERRLGQGKVASLLLLQSHEPACSRIGACFLQFCTTIHLLSSQPLEVCRLLSVSPINHSQIILSSWLRGAAATSTVHALIGSSCLCIAYYLSNLSSYADNLSALLTLVIYHMHLFL